jgi:integrase
VLVVVRIVQFEDGAELDGAQRRDGGRRRNAAAGAHRHAGCSHGQREARQGQPGGAARLRSELAALTCEQSHERDCRWVVADLIGKGGRVRTVPVPPWVKLTVDAWLEAGGIESKREQYPKLICLGRCPSQK